MKSITRFLWETKRPGAGLIQAQVDRLKDPKQMAQNGIRRGHRVRSLRGDGVRSLSAIDEAR